MKFNNFFRLFSLLCSPSLTASSPLSSLSPRTNPCSPGGTPVLYQPYWTNQCPPKNSLLPGGACPLGYSPLAVDCVSYCEIQQQFTYDEEKPVVNNPYCHGPLTCVVSTSQAFTYTYTVNGKVDVGWTKALTTGITGGLSYASATTQLQSTSVNLAEGQCGYFTFLPELRTSCGSLTQGIWGDDRCNFVTTTGNVCTTQAARTADGTGVLGATIFVRTDCGNNQRLPLDQQDPAYQHDGVAAPQSVYDAFISNVSTELCFEEWDCIITRP